MPHLSCNWPKRRVFSGQHGVRTFVLIHGNMVGGWVWAELQQELASRGHRVYALDLQWQPCAQTGQLPGLQEHVQQIKHLITQYQLSDVVLVGASYGGVPVMQAAAGLLFWTMSCITQTATYVLQGALQKTCQLCQQWYS